MLNNVGKLFFEMDFFLFLGFSLLLLILLGLEDVKRAHSSLVCMVFRPSIQSTLYTM